MMSLRSPWLFSILNVEFKFVGLRRHLLCQRPTPLEFIKSAIKNPKSKLHLHFQNLFFLGGKQVIHLLDVPVSGFLDIIQR
jgi:hypothetical protein